MSGIFRTNDPNQFARVDSIIIDEKAPAGGVTGTATNVAVMVGQFERGPSSLSLPLGSSGALREQYGDNDAYSGLNALKNKTYSALRLIRAIASDAVKANQVLVSAELRADALFKGSYGNGLKILIEDASDDADIIPAVAQIESLTARADSSDDLDGEGIILQDDAGSVAFWIDTDDSGTTIPAWASAADRAIEVTAIVTDDTAIAVAIAMAAAINGDSKFTVPVPSTAVFVATHTPAGARTSGAANGTGATAFTFVTDTLGADLIAAVEAGVKLTLSDTTTDAVLPDEVYDNVNFIGKTQQQVNEIFAGSRLMQMVVLATLTSNPTTQAATALTTGSDGTITDTDYEDAIVNAEEEGAGNVLFLDEYNAIRNGYLKSHAAAQQDKMVIICGLETDAVATVVADAANFRDADGRIIYGWPWVQTNINGVNVFQNPASWIAAAFSQTAAHISLAFVSTVASFSGANDLKFKVGRNPFISLNDAGVCGIQFDPDVGIKIRNAVTTHIINEQKRPILRRRMADFLTNSIALFLKQYDNDVNAVEKRDDVKAAILSFDGQQVNLGVLPGEQDVKGGKPLLIDTESANTDDVVAQGKFIILYKRRIFSSMRFIVLRAEIGTGVVVTEQEG